MSLGVLSGGSLADTRQMVEGALIERERQPQNVQVNLVEMEVGVAVCLEDGDGIFLGLPPVREEPATKSVPMNSGGSERLEGE